MKLRERILYHQIHPLKLAVDISAGIASTWLLWKHELLIGMLVAFVPAIAVSAAMLRLLRFQRQRDSAFGRYVLFHMTHVAEAVRMAGQVVVWIGTWRHSGWLIAAGACVILFGWTYSLPRWRPRRGTRA